MLGVGSAIACMRELTTLIPKDMLASMPFLQGLRLNGHIAGFAMLLAILAGVLFAVAPIEQIRRRCRERLAKFFDAA